MLKTGIHTLNSLISGRDDRTLFRKELKNASISLYEDACAQKEADTLTQRILLLFSDARGAYKRTYAKRFEDFDQEVLKILGENLDKKKNIKLHDLAVSDARTAVDFFGKLEKVCPKLDYTASDYNPTIKIIQKGRLKVALSDKNQILEVTFPPFVFNSMKRDSYRHYPLNHIIKWLVELLFVKPLIKEYDQQKVPVEEIFLFAPTAIRLDKEKSNFHLKQHDVLKKFGEKYTIIRAMNILNLSYFAESDFQTILGNLYNGLEDKGLLITGSNQEADTLVDGAIYKKTEGGFEVLWASGKGSPIHKYIEDFQLST